LHEIKDDDLRGTPAGPEMQRNLKWPLQHRSWPTMDGSNTVEPCYRQT